MPYELFWHGPISAYLQFRAKQYFLEKEQNRIAWLNGAYIVRAIGSVFGGNKSPYPPEPIKPIKPLTPEQESKHKEMINAIQEHNDKMRVFREQKAANLQQEMIGGEC